MKTVISFENYTDEVLVEQILKTKNTKLFEVLYDRYCNVVYNKCLSFSKNSAEAQDLAQDVFLRLFVKLGSFKGDSKFSTWLYALTYNYCVNYVNRNVSKQIEKKAIRFEDMDMEFVETSKSSLFALEVDKLRKALEIVNPEDKMILLLKYQDEMPINELSKVLMIGESAVKMRLKRARARVISVYNKMAIILWTILLKK